MNMDKIKFIHFEREGGDIKVKDLKIYAGCLGAPYEMEDIELHLTINDNGDIDILILNQEVYTKDELDDINFCLSEINWDNGYEVLHLYNLDGDPDLEPVYKIIGNRPSILFLEETEKNLNELNQ